MKHSDAAQDRKLIRQMMNERSKKSSYGRRSKKR